MVDKLLKALSHIGLSQAKYTRPSDVTKSKPFLTRHLSNTKKNYLGLVGFYSNLCTVFVM